MAWGMWLLMGVVFALILGAVVTLGWHTLFPTSFHWLDEVQIQSIKNFVLGGAVVGLGTSYLRRFLEHQ